MPQSDRNPSTCNQLRSIETHPTFRSHYLRFITNKRNYMRYTQLVQSKARYIPICDNDKWILIYNFSVLLKFLLPIYGKTVLKFAFAYFSVVNEPSLEVLLGTLEGCTKEIKLSNQYKRLCYLTFSLKRKTTAEQKL